MKKTYFFLLFSLLFSTSINAQSKKEVLLTIDDKPVFAEEFRRVFKKNLELVQDEDQKSVEGYLDLFINYKLKVAEAYEQKLNENPIYIREFNQYEDQLSKSYLYEDKFTEDLVKEAYNRGLEEIEASHLLIKVNPGASPADTLAAYTKISKLRERAINGEDFTTLIKQNSNEPGAKQRGGYLGYFTAFSMVYPFENMAYNTPVGEISEIVRTRFGYHILKVTDRREKSPEIDVSHIMIAHKKGEKSQDKTETAKERIYEIYQLLQQGESFESLAKQFSDDKNSAVNGGKLRPFSKGKLRAKEFEDEAYKLSKAGELSEPFKTDFGWHIIKFNKMLPIKSYDEKKPELERKVTKGDRSKVITNNVKKLIKQKVGLTKHTDYLPYFSTYVSDSLVKRSWKMTPIPKADDKKILSIGDQDFYYSDFATFIDKNQKRFKFTGTKESLLANYYQEFEDQKLKRVFRDKLEQENPKYAATINEYRDGLLIFDVMHKNIWSKAKTDSTEYVAYYEKNKENYKWKKRVAASIISSQQQEIANQVKQMLSNTDVAKIKETLNKDKVQVIVTSGRFEVDSDKLPPAYTPKVGVSDVFSVNESYVVIKTDDVLPPSIKELDEVRGKVISDYQTQLENEWVASLRKKFNVKINKKVLKKLIKEFKS